MVHDLGDIDLTDLDTFADGFPHDVFRLLRDQAPVWWHEPTAHTPDGEGFWSVATYDEVLQGAPRRRDLLVGDRRRPLLRQARGYVAPELQPGAPGTSGR